MKSRNIIDKQKFGEVIVKELKSDLEFLLIMTEIQDEIEQLQINPKEVKIVDVYERRM